MIEILLHDYTRPMVLNETMLEIEKKILDENKNYYNLQECHLKVREAWAKYCKENAVPFETSKGYEIEPYLKANPNVIAKIKVLDHDCYITYDYSYDTLDYFIIETVDTSKPWTIENFNLPKEECVRYLGQENSLYNFIPLQ